LKNTCIIRHLGIRDYREILEKMQLFTKTRNDDTTDEIWFLEHPQIFTQGQAGKSKHILKPSNIAIIQSDRGGQVTYHGPGQLIIYFLLDIRRKSFTIRDLVSKFEQIIIDLLANYEITAHRKNKAPGVYINDEKICSLGIRVRKGCCYHGLSLNIDMDLTPYQFINPCGYDGLTVTQLKTYLPNLEDNKINAEILKLIQKHLQYATNKDMIYP